MNRHERRRLAALKEKEMTITTTYDRLVGSDAALDAICKLRGLSAKDRMRLAQVRRHIQPDRQVIEDQRVELAKKYSQLGHERLIREAEERAKAMKDPEARERALAAVKSIPEPKGVLQNEMTDYQLEYSELLKQTVEVPVDPIPASILLGDDTILPEHLYALDWLIEDDVTAAPTPKKVPAKKVAQP